MAPRSGLSAQLGLKAESTYGTFVTPTLFYELESENIQNNIARMEVQDLRAGAFITRGDRWAAGRQEVKGDVNLSVLSNGFATLFHHCLGTVSNVTDGAGYHYTIKPGDLAGLSLTVQIGRPDVSGTVQPFSYTGMKVDSFDISNSSSDQMKLRLGLDGQAETTAQALAAASYTTNMEALYFTEGSITVAGSSFDVLNWNVTGTNAIKADRYYISATTPALKREPIRNAYASYGGSLVADFTNLTAYNRFVNGTTAQVVLTYQGLNQYDTGKFNRVIITIPNARFDGTTPNVSGPDILQVSLPFVCLDDPAGVNPALQIEVYTADAPSTV